MDASVDWPIHDLVSRQAAITPDRMALVDADSGRAWTYRELSVGPVAALAAGLADAGVAAGDRLGVALDPGVRVAQLVHAAARVGARLVPLPPGAPLAVLGDRSAAADVDVVVSTAASTAGLDGFDGPVVASAGLEADGPGPDPHRWHRDDVQWLVFTSGTVDDPRPVQLTAGNLVASATASARRLGVEPDDRWLACLPMHHVAGLAPVVRTAHDGTAVVVQASFEPAATARAITTHGVTGVSLVPTMLARLLDAGWSAPEALRFVLLGGAPAPPDLIERCRATGVPLHPTYGATETASQIATARPSEAFEHPGTVGRPLAGMTVCVRDPAGRATPAGEPGELVVAGPSVSPGYYGGPDVSARRFDDRGRFWTRDRGYLDDAGRLWVLGRLDDAIVTGGETVQPGAVESAFRTHPAVEDVAAVGLDDDEWGQVVGALVRLRPSATVDASALRDHCRARLEPHAVPKVVASTDALPRTPSGTVDRDAVRARLRSASPSEAL